jgi:hypothetical protein
VATPPWWRRSSLLITAVVVLGLVVALTVVLLNRPVSAQTVMLQPAGSTGPNPFTPPAHTHPSPSHSAAPLPSGVSPAAGGVHTVSGTSVGLYGGTEHLSSCDVPQMSAFLRVNPDKGRAWAEVEGIRVDQIDAFLHSLTPVVLRTDTRVTNHGFANGAATSFQSVLQAGTAVLVDSYGAPRARCACGNPLLAPVVTTRSSYTGTSWSSFDEQNITVILPAVTQVDVIVLYDDSTGQWLQRPTGGAGSDDVGVLAPVSPTGGASGSAGATSGASSTCLPGAPPPPSAGTANASGSSSPGSAQACPSGSSSATSSGTATSSAFGSPSASPSGTPSAVTPSGAMSSGPGAGTSGSAPAAVATGPS